MLGRAYTKERKGTRISLEGGRSGRTEERGNSMERFGVELSSVVMPRIL